MNIYIEDAESLEFLTTSGQWTKNTKKAKTFDTIQIALQAAKLEAIARFNIVRYFPMTQQFVNMDQGKGKGRRGGPGGFPRLKVWVPRLQWLLAFPNHSFFFEYLHLTCVKV